MRALIRLLGGVQLWSIWTGKIWLVWAGKTIPDRQNFYGPTYLTSRKPLIY